MKPRRLIGIVLTVLVVLGGAGYLLMPLRPPAPPGPGEVDLVTFGRLPVKWDGRVKPIDTLARTSLMVLRNRQTLRFDDGRQMSATQWLLDLTAQPRLADDYPVIRIDDPDIVERLGKDRAKQKYFSFNEVRAGLRNIQAQIAEARGRQPWQRSTYDRNLLKLDNKLGLYAALQSLRGVLAAPLDGEPDVVEEGWLDVPLLTARQAESVGVSESVGYLLTLRAAYAAGNADAFNKVAADYHRKLADRHPGLTRTAAFEWWFNRLEPFYRCMLLYGGVFLLACIALAGAGEATRRPAFWLLALAVAAHTFGLGARMWIQDRPPVINLYSSAVFIGWVVAVVVLVIEGIFRNAVATLPGAVIGFATLIIAHILSFDGDTMESLRAVLDTNLWLATHVVCITIGYAATYLAGVLAVLYIVMGVFTPALTSHLARAIGRIVYGVICFALLFSFVGTVLGGIWADQSWGRFWGWDPKENGALIIVIWNALILHARWGGMVRIRGLMVLTVFGNIVTTWSWFGTNLLQVGLHSYGFMDGAFRTMVIFMLSQLLLMAIGLLPERWWWSTRTAAGKAPVPPVPARP